MKHLARKRFGQNFLVDRSVIDAIVRAIAPQPGDVIVEIGPGLGALTLPLLAAMPGQTLHVVELDRDLAARLEKMQPRQRLCVHQADALQFAFAQLVSSTSTSTLTSTLTSTSSPSSSAPAPTPSAPPSPSRKLRVCGNLPYNISSPLLFHLLDAIGHVRDQHFMLQKEVVERMTASPGNKDYGRLSVMLQVHYEMELLFEVPPEAFEPAPRVDSAIVRMMPRATSLLPVEHAAIFAGLVSKAFSQRRKMLRNTLRDYAAPLEQTGIDATQRAEDVSVAQYLALSAAVASKTPTPTSPAPLHSVR